MADVTTRKRKRVSKNKKRNWRKHVDITDVDDYLEDKRLQERTGGLVAEKPDESLFFVDTSISLKSKNEDVPVKRRKREPKPLRCYANLEPDPRIPAVTVKRLGRSAKKIEKKKLQQVKDKEAKGVISITKQKAFKQRKQAKIARVEKGVARRQLPVADYDLWADDDGRSKNAEDEHFLRVTRKAAIKVPVNIRKKPSGLPAVEIPHPGASYNPSFEDHQELLHVAHAEELKKDREEKRIKRQLDEKFPTVDEAPTQQTWIQEMSAGLYEENSDGEEVGDLNRLSHNPPVNRGDKKTQAQRNKEKRRKELEVKRRKDKLAKMKNTEVFKLKSIKKQVIDREKEFENRVEHKKQLREMYKDKTKKLGKLKFEPPELELKLSTEIEGSLRSLKPEGHLLEDRFKSLQKRNIIETRVRAKNKKKYKDKVFEKPGHKEIML